MILHMSRGFITGVLALVFGVGGLTGWLLRGPSGHALASMPALSRTDAPPGVEFAPPRPSLSRTQGVLKAVPTPGAYYRLGAGETLSEVAKRAYGTTKRLPDLLAANPTLEPTRLAAMTLLYVPLGVEAIHMPPIDLWRPEGARPDDPKPKAPKPAAKPSPPKPAPAPTPVFSK